MKSRGRRGDVIVPALAACFCIGILVGWWLRSGAPMPAASVTTPLGRIFPEPAAGPDDRSAAPNGSLAGSTKIGGSEVAATTGEPLVEPASPADRPTRDTISDLRGHALRLPLDGVSIEAMKGGFAERRDAGGRPHEAVDILAPRNTPIHAVEDGAIAKLFTSKAGGLTIYQFDPTERFCYYYAHLERYAAGLREGQKLSRGDIIGYVGTSGNAPPNTPHLHFAIFELDTDRHWWKGRAIDPYLIFRP